MKISERTIKHLGEIITGDKALSPTVPGQSSSQMGFALCARDKERPVRMGWKRMLSGAERSLHIMTCPEPPCAETQTAGKDHISAGE
jgi:hypothetical protein